MVNQVRGPTPGEPSFTPGKVNPQKSKSSIVMGDARVKYKESQDAAPSKVKGKWVKANPEVKSHKTENAAKGILKQGESKSANKKKVNFGDAETKKYDPSNSSYAVSRGNIESEPVRDNEKYTNDVDLLKKNNALIERTKIRFRQFFHHAISTSNEAHEVLKNFGAGFFLVRSTSDTLN